ncbi:hypothetical protein HDU76_001688 [Blyttiomyces sp. JEL0837]|nr:hypothetical protein HDU76_001688 [Blyttiomyces sp. JEL0837]
MTSYDSTADEAVRGTNDDATISRLSAVNLGYIQDPFISHFVKGSNISTRSFGYSTSPQHHQPPFFNTPPAPVVPTRTVPGLPPLSQPLHSLSLSERIPPLARPSEGLSSPFQPSTLPPPASGMQMHSGSGTRRPPIINRGTFARWAAIHSLVTRFLNGGDGDSGKKQIVALGAGSDTRFFLLKNENLAPCKYFEIDFPEITAKKARSISKAKALTNLIGEYKIGGGGTELHSSQYNLIGGDLRKWETDIVPKLKSLGFSESLPTMYISECVLVYLPPESSKSILTWCANATRSSFFLTYEQIHPDDAFGKVMIENLKLRNIYLPGLESTPTLDSHKSRYVECGFNGGTGAIDILDFYDRVLDHEERDRVAKLEIFDEVEEWRMFGKHYCVSWGWNVRGDLGGGHEEEGAVKKDDEWLGNVGFK